MLCTTWLLVGLGGCSGGSGSGTTLAPVAVWEKFRHDASNTGLGNGTVANNNAQIKWQTSIDGTPISASPAIDTNGVVYIGTERGTLAALDPASVPAGDRIKWTVCSCDAPGSTAPLTCSTGTAPSLGALISSPAVYAFNSQTNIFIGSDRVGSNSGALYVFQDNGTSRTCAVRFEPEPCDFQQPPCKAPTPSDATIASRFISSPTFIVNPATLVVAGIFVGAAVDVTQGGATRTVGKLYGLNTDGSVIWQFPRPGAEEIGAVTSSPAIGPANSLYFTSTDGNLYALANDGTFKWSFPIGAVSDPRGPFSASPLVASLIFAASADGQVVAVNPDGSFRWSVSSGDGTRFVSSLAIGFPAATPTSTATELPATPPPGATATPNWTNTSSPTPMQTAPPGATATPTPTETPVLPTTTIFGITTSGMLVVIDATTGEPRTLEGPVAPIIGPVVSSPLLSTDSYLVVGAANGQLHAINTGTGTQPTCDTQPPCWPVQLAPSVKINSSPSISNDGVVYVGADNGMLYAVGTQ